jgi:ribosome-associated heat shock protein Hsp15
MTSSALNRVTIVRRGAYPFGMRLDKWLWFVRFFKTRSLATQAVSGGHIKVNGERVKPAHTIRTGDRLILTINQETLDIEVRELPMRRGPASEARSCYAETPDSLRRRVVFREQRRIAEMSRPQSDTRPDKRERRQLDKLRRGQG